jgi:hypothetical protein
MRNLEEGGICNINNRHMKAAKIIYFIKKSKTIQKALFYNKKI